MGRTIALNGNWILSGADKDGKNIRIEATVPGCVHTDLIAEGIIKDIYYRDNSKNIQWIEDRDFTYTRSFFVEELLPCAYLEFDGLDTYADIFLNGVLVGSADDMFMPYEFCVDGILKEGENLLAVCLRSPVREVADKPLRNGAFTRERMNTRRIQCTYGWDWVDRFVTMGIYKDVRLCFRERNEIDSFYVFTKDINPYSAQIKLEMSFRDFCDVGDKVSIEICDPDGCPVFSKERVILRPSLYEYIDIRDPKLWYPRGYGEQPLYTLTVSTPTSSKSHKIGLRRITVLQLEDEKGSEDEIICRRLQSFEYLKGRDENDKTSCFALLVNGVRIMCKGGNWVPCEPFPSAETPEKITRILELSVDMGANMIRVWGGGIFECDHLYEECDRLGILVSQDFLMACGSYPEEEEWFIDALRREARAAALRLRNHACLAFWSGDNENAEWGNENIVDFPGYRSATYGIEPVVSALDPERYFFPSSPYGGNRYSSATKGTTHNTNFIWYQLQYFKNNDMIEYREFFSRFVSRFCAEQAAFGMSFPSSLEKYLDRDDIYGDDDSMIEHHTKGNPDFKDMTLYGYISMTAEKIFGKYKSGIDRVIKQGMLHCEWVRLTFELYRRYKGFANGVIYWMLNDCWPAASGWSFIDHYACPKPAYYVFKRCAKPVVAVLMEEQDMLTLHISNDSDRAVKGCARIYVYDALSGVERDIANVDITVGADRAERVFGSDYSKIKEMMSDRSVILCDISTNLGEDRAMLVQKRYCDLSVDYDRWSILSEDGDSITVRAEKFSPYVMIDVPYLLSDNCFCLKQGEIRTVTKISKL